MTVRRIRSLLSVPYALPLRVPWRSARETLERRQGWLLRLAADGLTGYGDCAPLPAAGTESPETAAAALRDLASRCPGREPRELLDHPPATLEAAPAARHALECALLDLLSRAAALPLRRWLAPASADAVQVNAMLGTLERTTPALLQAAADQGFQICKLKVGVAPVARELSRLRRLAATLPPGLRLRLDANGAWTWREALTLLQGLRGLPIESLEEPLAAASPEALGALQAETDIVLALDETLAGWLRQRSTIPADPDLAALELAAMGVRRLILKPGALGGPRRTLALAARARAAGLDTVVTSLIESAAGLWHAAQLAAAVDARACDRGAGMASGAIAHGLATAEWLAEDLGAAPRPRQGRLRLPLDPGCGFVPCREPAASGPDPWT